MRCRTRWLALTAITVLGCANKDDASSKRSSSADGGAGSVAKPRPAVVPPKVDEATVHPVTASVMVVVNQDGAVSIVPLPDVEDPAGIDLATLAPGADVPIAELAAKTDAVQVQVLDARRGVVDAGGAVVEPDGGDGTMILLDEGRMRGTGPIGRYDRKTPTFTPFVDPCASGLVNGDLLDDDPRGTGWGVVGGKPRRIGAGLRGRSVMASPFCGDFTPLVVADARTSAARLVEVLSALPAAQLAVTTDGTHARTLAVVLSYRQGNTPVGDDLELGFTVSPDGVKGSAYRGTQPDAQVWSWDGAGAISDAYHKGQATDALVGNTVVRIRIDGDLAARALVETIAELLAANVVGVAIGEPTVYTPKSGYGVGGSRGGMRSSPIRMPSVRIGQPSGSVDLDKATVRRYVKRHLDKIKYCYQKQLLAKPHLQGTVDTTWTIQPNGTVKGATAKGLDAKVSSCIADVLGAIEYPKPKSGGVVTVTSYPFEFHPDGG